MVKDDKRGHRSWWWILPSAAGLALIMMAILLWSSGPGNPGTPAAQAQEPTATPPATRTPTPTITPTPNNCTGITISKDADDDEVVPDGEITYTITVEFSGDDDCDDVTIEDVIPDDTNCVSIDVTDDGGLDVDLDDDDCASSGTVTWEVNDAEDADDGDEIVLEMVVELNTADDGDEIDNEACVLQGAEEEDCDTVTVDVDEDAATKTPTPGPTATVAVPTVRPVVPVAPPPVAPPVVAPAPTTLIAPLTGSGAESGAGGSQPLALALGLAGGCLLLLSGAALLRRPR